jgi:hypothetical protein
MFAVLKQRVITGLAKGGAAIIVALVYVTMVIVNSVWIADSRAIMRYNFRGILIFYSGV